MEKTCVFCGEKPQKKNLEHIIPQWLIELTGDSDRNAFFGYKEWLNSAAEKRIFSFDSFQFPACSSCNQKFANLEELTKPIVCKILSEDAVSAIEFNTLLDWLDKVRVGLWLGYWYLDKTTLVIRPKFHISERIGAHDRMLAIYRTDRENKGLNFSDCSSLSFRYMPSCFCLFINNFVFFNISYDFLFSRRIGFPYPSETFFVESNDINDEPIVNYHFNNGRNRVMVPVLKKRIRIKTTEIYQPMYSQFLKIPELKQLYKTKYVIDNSISQEEGIGKVFIEGNDNFIEYPTTSSKLWLPEHKYSYGDLFFNIQLLVMEWQSYLDGFIPSVKMLSKERKNNIQKMQNLKKLYNDKIMDLIRSQKLKYL